MGAPIGTSRTVRVDLFVSFRPRRAPAVDAASDTVRPCLANRLEVADEGAEGGSRRLSEPVTLLNFAPTSEREGMRRRACDALRRGVEEFEVRGFFEPDASGEPGPSRASSWGAEHKRESMACLALPCL